MSFQNNNQLSEYINDVFFETGTYLGHAARSAADLGFKKVITVELQERLYLESKELSKDYPQIEFYLGDSPQVMKEILPTIDRRITFWLDAHIDGGNYVPGLTPEIRQCPLYEELDFLKTLSRNDHTIIIDDMRIIGVLGWGIGTYKDELIRKLKEINPDYEISFIDGCEPNDILVAKI
jgi:hypothetical protein